MTTKITKKFQNGLFIFRRDLRIVDNNCLNLATKLCHSVRTIFIFTPEQISNKNPYKSDNAVQFMLESLEQLSDSISEAGGQLETYYGDNIKVIRSIILANKPDCIFFNADYSPYAINRDKSIAELCNKYEISTVSLNDYYLFEPGTILNGSGETYQKFTPFYETCLKHKVQAPLFIKPKFKDQSYTKSKTPYLLSLASAIKKFLPNKNKNQNILVHGGRLNALKQIQVSYKNIKHYNKTHNNLSLATSQLSAYIKFGCVSIREIYNLFRSNKDFIRQLFWRDFYANILFAYPHVLGHTLKPKYNKIGWHHNERWFKAWTHGITGFPIVDAGMRQLVTTGYMHNRARLITATFLIKTLLISWEKGEQFFATMLTDYDPASNNGNWQWCAGSGADSQPYFRIFNPWLQQREHDADCVYIKTWIPELKDVPVNIIHNWDTEFNKHKDIKYAKPICDYDEQKDKIMKMYKEALY
jgi:deoxyribodipyrimidine photo-lyase